MLIKKIYRLFPIETQYKIGKIIAFFRDKKTYEFLKSNDKYTTSFGDNNIGKHFYVLRRDPYATGLLSCYLCILGQMVKIHKKVSKGKLIPVVDMYTKYFNLIHNTEKDVMNNNGWDCYFKPLSNYSMMDVLSSKKVTFGISYTPNQSKPFYDNSKVDFKLLDKFYYINNKYINLKDELLLDFETEKENLFGNKRVLGTNVREGYIVLNNGRANKESSYNGEIISGHPIQPDLNLLCDELEKKMKEWNCDYIYAEFQTTFVEKIFKDRFGDRFLCTNRDRIHVDNLSLNSWKEAQKSKNQTCSMVENNIAYLKSIYLLSKCTSLYSPKCSGTIVASIWNNKRYENIEILRTGCY